VQASFRITGNIADAVGEHIDGAAFAASLVRHSAHRRTGRVPYFFQMMKVIMKTRKCGERWYGRILAAEWCGSLATPSHVEATGSTPAVEASVRAAMPVDNAWAAVLDARV
jgi:hypothetical protein